MATVAMMVIIMIAGFSAALALDILMSGRGEVVCAAAFAVVAAVAFSSVLIITQRGVDRAVAEAGLR